MRWPGWDCRRTTFRNSPVHAVRALSLAKARARDDARSRAGANYCERLVRFRSGQLRGELFPDLDAFPIPPRPQFLRSSQGDLASPIAVPGVACLGINLDRVRYTVEFLISSVSYLF